MRLLAYRFCNPLRADMVSGTAPDRPELLNSLQGVKQQGGRRGGRGRGIERERKRGQTR